MTLHRGFKEEPLKDKSILGRTLHMGFFEESIPTSYEAVFYIDVAKMIFLHLRWTQKAHNAKQFCKESDLFFILSFEIVWVQHLMDSLFTTPSINVKHYSTSNIVLILLTTRN